MRRASWVVVASLLGAGSASAAPPAAAADPEAKARSWFTDTRLVDQRGKELRFYTDVLADRIVVIDFIFTRCEMACPLLTEKMNRVREGLGPVFGKEVFFVSMSIDPTRDTPQDLARFSERHRAVHPAWSWLTGKKEDVQLVTRRLGEWVDDPDQHGTEFIVGNTRTRHWIRIRPDLPAAAAVLQIQRLVEEGGGSARTAAAVPKRN